MVICLHAPKPLTSSPQGSRLLGLPDLRTVLSVLVLIMNCIHESSERGYERRSSPAYNEIRFSPLLRQARTSYRKYRYPHMRFHPR